MNKPGFIERRRYFRLDDRALLAIQAIPKEEAKLDQETDVLSLDTLEQQISGLLYQVQSLQPEVARLFSLLNQKLNRVIAQTVKSDENEEALPELQPTDINLSACGMRFNTSEDLSAAEWVKVYLTLLPSHTPLTLFARVVAIEPSQQSEQPNLIRLDFGPINTQDRETLIQHMLQLQTRQLKASRDTAKSNNT